MQKMTWEAPLKNLLGLVAEKHLYAATVKPYYSGQVPKYFPCEPIE